MEFGRDEDVGIGMCLCRICHEEEDEKSTTMESPCSCSGTLKFAHRECIQKWCNEKGNIVCEICLQKIVEGALSLHELAKNNFTTVPVLGYWHEDPRLFLTNKIPFDYRHFPLGGDMTILARNLTPFKIIVNSFVWLLVLRAWSILKFEPGYTVPPKLALIDIAVTIRGSLEVPRQNYESQNQGMVDDESDEDNPDCSPASNRGAIMCRAIALIFTLILLARHFLIVVSAGSGHYPFPVATVFLLRASGILLPLYCIVRMTAAYQKARRQHMRYRSDSSPIHRAEGEEAEELAHHTIQIQS